MNIFHISGFIVWIFGLLYFSYLVKKLCMCQRDIQQWSAWKNILLLFIFKYWLIIEISPKYVTPRNSQQVFSDNYVVFLIRAQDMEILHARTWNKALIITLNGPLYKSVEETFHVTFFHVYQPRIAFHDQTGVFRRTESNCWPRVKLTFKSNTSAGRYVRLTKEGNKVRSARRGGTEFELWIWLRAVGTEADVCEVVKISPIMRQGDKQVPDRSDSPLPPPQHQ